jgi:hypothetical protein
MVSSTQNNNNLPSYLNILNLFRQVSDRAIKTSAVNTLDNIKNMRTTRAGSPQFFTEGTCIE